MRDLIENIVQNSGIWRGERAVTHGFLLTPDVFEISSHQAERLRAVGPALTRCLAGFGRIAAIAADSRLAPGRAWSEVRRVINGQVPATHRRLQVLRPAQTPAIIKTDWVEDQAGRLWLMEIDAMNRRGLGYASLFREVARITSNQPDFGGSIGEIAKLVRIRGASTLVYLYAHRERFYRPEFEIFAAQMASQRIETVLVDEGEMVVSGDMIGAGGRFFESPILLNFPIFSEGKNRATEEELARLYAEGRVQCLIPPKPFLGSKGLLALLRNDHQERVLEGVLTSQIDPADLDLVRAAIPPTHFVTKDWPERISGRYVLKEAISAGTHGVVFSDDDRFLDKLAAARRAPGLFTLQQEVDGRQRVFRHYPREGGQAVAGSYFTRLIVYFVGGKPTDAVATACSDKLVHGGKSALFLNGVLA